MNLTDEQLNIAICEWRGWKRVEIVNFLGAFWRWLSPQGTDTRDLPNHVTGIEALGHLYGAEKALTDDQYSCYASSLYDIQVTDDTGDRKTRWLSPAARQRAIALLRVVNPEIFQ